MDILRQRLLNQRLIGEKFESPEDAVSYFGAVQSQDFAGAKWSLGLRIKNSNNSLIEKAYNEGKILRTHVLRPTWHFVVPSDIRAFLSLSAPRIKQITGYYSSRLGLTDELITKTNNIIPLALKNHNYLTRQEIKHILEKEGIKTEVQSLSHIVMNAEIDGLITSGPLRNKQFTYALLHERIGKLKALNREEAIARLAEKYFISHGPALLKDFAWWSGLSSKDAANALQMISSKLEKIKVNNKEYWFDPKLSSKPESKQEVFLMSVYDEYFISYADRSEFYDAKHKEKLPIGNALLTSLIICNGKVAGTWKRTISKKGIDFKLFPFLDLNKKQKEETERIIEEYKKFFAFK